MNSPLLLRVFLTLKYPSLHFKVQQREISVNSNRIIYNVRVRITYCRNITLNHPKITNIFCNIFKFWKRSIILAFAHRTKKVLKCLMKAVRERERNITFTWNDLKYHLKKSERCITTHDLSKHTSHSSSLLLTINKGHSSRYIQATVYIGCFENISAHAYF